MMRAVGQTGRRSRPASGAAGPVRARPNPRWASGALEAGLRTHGLPPRFLHEVQARRDRSVPRGRRLVAGGQGVWSTAGRRGAAGPGSRFGGRGGPPLKAVWSTGAGTGQPSQCHDLSPRRRMPARCRDRGHASHLRRMQSPTDPADRTGTIGRRGLRRHLRGRLPGVGRLAARRRVECELVEDDGAFVAHRPTDADRPRRVAFVDGTLRTEARLTRTGPDGNVSMGLAGSWAAGAVLVDGDEPARFDHVTTGRAAIFTGGRPVRLPDHRDGWRWEPVRGRRHRRRRGASAAPAPDA